MCLTLTPESYPPMIASGMSNEQAPNKKEINKFKSFISELDRPLNLLEEGKEIKKKKISIGLLNQLLPMLSCAMAQKLMGEKYINDFI